MPSFDPGNPNMNARPAALAALLFCAAAGAAKPFTAHDLVMLERVSDPRLSPSQRYVAYQLRETDFAANKGVHGIWLADLTLKGAPPRRLTATGTESNTPRWSGDGRLYFLSTRSGGQQLWRLDLAGGEAQQVTRLPLDVAAYRLSPDGKRVLLALEVLPGCTDLACTRSRLDERAAQKARGQVFDRLFEGFDPDASAADVARRNQYRKSVLDAVLAQATELKGKLNATDAIKMEEYLAAVREVERRIELASGGSCTPPTKEDGDLSDQQRHEVLNDLIALAFQCDITRVGTYMFEHSFSDTRSFNFLQGVTARHHEITHSDDAADQEEKINTFYIQRFAYLLSKLKAATEGDYQTPTCPACSVKMVTRKSTTRGRTYWGCRNYPACKHTFSEIS